MSAVAAPKAATTEPMAAIRYKDGAVDDVAVHGDLMRLEQMDDAVWWPCIYRGKARTAFSLRLEGPGIVAEVIEDSIGCHDDSQGGERMTEAVTTEVALRERLAAVQHDIWGHWMRWQFTQGVANEDGSFTIRADKVLAVLEGKP